MNVITSSRLLLLYCLLMYQWTIGFKFQWQVGHVMGRATVVKRLFLLVTRDELGIEALPGKRATDMESSTTLNISQLSKHDRTFMV